MASPERAPDAGGGSPPRPDDSRAAERELALDRFGESVAPPKAASEGLERGPPAVIENLGDTRSGELSRVIARFCSVRTYTRRQAASADARLRSPGVPRKRASTPSSAQG